MHKISISQSVIDRVVARRGREHIFDDLVPAKTALVVVDMQNGFMVPERRRMRPARWRTRSCPTSTGWRRRCATPAAR